MSLSRSKPMNRGTKPLARTPFKPKTPNASKEPAPEPKPPKGPRKRKCQHCKAPFQPFRALEAWCSPECGSEVAKARLAKQRAKQQRQERAQDKVKREGMKTYPQLIRETQRVFNQAVRLRDQIAGYACISSGRPLDWSGNKVDAGHYRSTGSAPHLRFNWDNCHAQDKGDNLWLSGNAVDYRIGLIARIGLERVEALEADNKPRKWSHDELRSMKEEFQRMVRELKKDLT